MSKERGYLLTIDAEDDSVISKVLEHEGITKWAYILHDKDIYNEHDSDSRRINCQRVWAEGFPEQEKYASVEDFIDDCMNKPPFIGDKKDPLWQVVCITDKAYTNSEIAKWFGISGVRVMFLSDRLSISDSLKSLMGEDDFSRCMEKHLYYADEVHANFDFREYISSVEKNRKWELTKRNFDPAMLSGMLFFSFIIVCAVKLSSSSNHPWKLFGIVAGIGILYLVLNFMAIQKGKRENRFISGIPFIGGIHLLIAGILSPCKWLALLCILDFTGWQFLGSMHTSKKE